MTSIVEPIEAVIISGPRRGEIITLQENTASGVSEEEIETLNDALDELLVAIEKVAVEVRATTAALQEEAETP